MLTFCKFMKFLWKKWEIIGLVSYKISTKVEIVVNFIKLQNI